MGVPAPWGPRLTGHDFTSWAKDPKFEHCLCVFFALMSLCGHTHPCIVHSFRFGLSDEIHTKWLVEKIDEQMTDNLGHSAPTYFFG